MGMRSDSPSDSIGLQLGGGYSVSPRDVSSTDRLVIDSSGGLSSGFKPTRRRYNSVTFRIDHDTSSSITPLTDEGCSTRGDIPWPIGKNPRRMSAPELPPIRNNSGKNSSNSGHFVSKPLPKIHSSGSFGEKRGVNTRSPHSYKSSSSGFSNKIVQSTGTGSVSGNLSSEHIPNTSSLKLETLFEKKNGMTKDSGTPRTTSSHGGYSQQKLGRMPSLTKMNITNNNNSTSNRMSTRDSRGIGKKKKPLTINHSSSETQLISKAPVRLQSRLGRSSTSSGHNYNNNNNDNNSSHLNLTRSSFEQRIKNNTKCLQNGDKDRKRITSFRVPDSVFPKNLQSGTVNGMRKYSSTVALDTLSRRKSKEDGELDAEGTDEDEEMNKRVLDWLIGADEAEVPPEPEIVHIDEPPQTDTALHIVYDEN